MEETKQPPADQDPAPIEHSDAERVTGEEADGATQERPEAERENDDDA